MTNLKDNKTPVDKPVEKTSSDSNIDAPKNPLAIKWPVDPQGVLGPLREGGLKAAGRIRGDEAKMKKFLKYLEILASHAKVKYEYDVASHVVAKKNALSARTRVAEKLKRQAEAKAKEFEAAADRVRSQAGLKVKTGKKEG